MKYGIVGSKFCSSPQQGYAILRRFLQPGDTIMAVSALPGGTTIEEKFAANNGHKILVIRGEKKSNHLQVMEESDEIIAFMDSTLRWERIFHGAKHAICYARENNKPIHMYWV